MKKIMWRIMVVGFGFGLLSSTVQAEIRYTITDLGVLGGYAGSRANAINDLGQIVGETGVGDPNNPNSRAFMYTNGIMTNIGTLEPPPWDSTSSARGINNLGSVVGYAMIRTGDFRAFLWNDGVMSQIGTLGGYSYAHDINDQNQIVGNSYLDGGLGTHHAFLWDHGTMTDLGTLSGGNSVANAINNVGQVIGLDVSPTDVWQAFLYENGKMSGLGTLGGRDSCAVSMNNLGQVVGYSLTSEGESHGFLYENGIMKDLGTLGGDYSYAFAINDLGQIVGTSNDGLGNYFLFQYDNGVMVNLTSLLPTNSGWTNLQPYSMNNSGQIVGVGLNSDNQYHGFLINPVPEPATLSLLALGGLALVRRKL